MKNIQFIVMTLMTTVSFGQTEKMENETLTKVFIEHYNKDAYELIFSMFSTEMQAALPLEKTTGFLKGLKAQAGKIIDHEFVKYENGTFAFYKTTFERGLLSLNVSVDKNSKINGLLVKPYIEESPETDINNNLTISENGITLVQADILFKNIRDFPNQTQVAIGIINQDTVIFYGVQRNASAVSNIDNAKSIFEIGSISKVFTATLLSSFVIDKKIKLNEPINDHLNLSLNNKESITFQELSNHTSGLPRLPSNLNLATVDPTNPYKNYNEKDLVEYITESVEISRTATKKYEYSNLGAGLLGYTLSRIEGISFDSLLTEKIFSKYNMPNSTTKHSNIKEPLIPGLDAEGKEVSNWEFSVLAGAGGILSNVTDLSKFMVAQFDKSNKALYLSRQKTFDISDNMGIGLGWHLIKSKNGNTWNWHNGGTGGYSSSMTVDIQNKTGVIVLSNVSAFNPNMGNIDNLCFDLMETLRKQINKSTNQQINKSPNPQIRTSKNPHIHKSAHPHIKKSAHQKIHLIPQILLKFIDLSTFPFGRTTRPFLSAFRLRLTDKPIFKFIHFFFGRQIFITRLGEGSGYPFIDKIYYFKG